jgi:CCR4-NOT transcription complex subunit 10
LKLKIDLDDLQTLESSEYCIIYYNYAILLFNYKLFNKSLIVIEKILEFVDSLDDNLTREVFLLAIVLYLKTSQVKSIDLLILHII